MSTIFLNLKILQKKIKSAPYYIRWQTYIFESEISINPKRIILIEVLVCNFNGVIFVTKNSLVRWGLKWQILDRGKAYQSSERNCSLCEIVACALNSEDWMLVNVFQSVVTQELLNSTYKLQIHLAFFFPHIIWINRWSFSLCIWTLKMPT